MRKRDIKNILKSLDNTPIPDKKKILKNIPGASVTVFTDEQKKEDTPLFALRHLNTRPVLITLMCFLIIGGSITGIAISAESRAYNEAVEYLSYHDINIEGMSRSEIKELYQSMKDAEGSDPATIDKGTDSDSTISPETTDAMTEAPEITTLPETISPETETKTPVHYDTDLPEATTKTPENTDIEPEISTPVTERPTDPGEYRVYDSSELSFPQLTSVSCAELLTMLEESASIYRDYDEIRLKYFDIGRLIDCGYIRAYVKEYGESAYSSAFGKSSEDALAQAGQIRSIFPSEAIINKDYDLFTIEQYAEEYELVVLSILIDRLVASMPNRFIDTANGGYIFDNIFEPLELTDFSAELKIALNEEYTAAADLEVCISAGIFAYAVYNYADATTEDVFPIMSEREEAETLCFREPPTIPPEGVNESAYIKELAEYLEWQNAIEEYLKNRQ